ncbi:hypothetical protein [Escherichia coli]|uniref:hypothetical protein n=1 Tax=Escherichia coli TaxID=562 RepID=UPI002036376B|nr:hypothetical protein [Escherichia coli]
MTGNTFYAPANITDSAAVTIRANINGCAISGNMFDCRYMIYNAPGMTTVQVKNLVWDRSNIIGCTHANQRAEQNLFDMQFASVVSSTIEVQLSCEDLSMFSCILFPASCQLSYSKITVDSAWTNSMSNTAVFEGNQQAGANVYVSYPATVNLTSYNTQGAVPFFSTDTNYAWVTSAYSLSINENLDFSPPATYTNKANGQLVGVGYNEIGEVRSVSVRLMLQRQV